MSTNIGQQSKSSFSCGLVTQRDSRDLTAIIIVLVSDALAFGIMMIVTKLLTNSAVKKYKKGIKRNESWIVFTFCERPRIIQHNIVPMSTIHHSHPLGSVSPHYSFGGHTSPEPSLHSAEATLANEIKSTDKSKSVAFNEVEIVDCLHGRASSESDKKETHLGGFFSISDEAILERRGVDALNYLLFLRHLIFFLAIISVLCIFIILPINLMGNYVRGKSLFSRLTIENVPPGSEYLWTHIAVANLFLPIGIFFLLHNHASTRLNKDRFATRTLFIRKTVNKKGALAREDIAALIQEITTNELVIEGIQFVYDVRGMKQFKDDFVLYFNAEKFCLDYLDEYDESFELRPYRYGQWLGLLGLGLFFPKTFGLTYYRTKKWEAVRNLLREYTKTMGNAQGAFFITFRTESMARSVYQQINTTSCILQYFPNNSYCNSQERNEAESWQASFAPDPTDINWDALVINKKGMWFRTFGVNFLLFIIFFFCTTPSFILPYISNFPANSAFFELQKKYEHELKPISFLAQFLKPLVLLLVASILPSVVYYFSSLVPDPLKSEQTHGVMWRVYCFMILMIIIIPSLGQSSFHEVVRSILLLEMDWNY
ncbi:CSC1-like protein 1 isoform X2 [Tetranychus urticae]|uniref:CSC1-like protein 1 isoform X2 n=1 Tax=Tetranychus urticae TaxID=32264 RepID=UPI000D6503E4|nr:CSC1-like protein 1 isoform X2 [Tetranychus urticae]